MRQRFKTCRLPNGLEIAHLSKTDTDLVYQEIFEEDVYRKHGVTIRDGDCILDVGANIGLFAVFVSQICRSGTLLACEPVPAICDVLRRNVELHGRLDIRTLNVGLSSAPATAEFSYYPRISCASTMYPDDSPEERQRATEYIVRQFDELPNRPLRAALGFAPRAARYALAGLVRRHFARRHRVTCTLTTVSRLLREQRIERIDLLKLDAERSERDVLAGIDDADWPRIRQAVVEVHEGPEVERAVTTTLVQRGFRVVAEGNPHFPNIAMLYAVRA